MTAIYIGIYLLYLIVMNFIPILLAIFFKKLGFYCGIALILIMINTFKYAKHNEKHYLFTAIFIPSLVYSWEVLSFIFENDIIGIIFKFSFANCVIMCVMYFEFLYLELKK